MNTQINIFYTDRSARAYQEQSSDFKTASGDVTGLLSITTWITTVVAYFHCAEKSLLTHNIGNELIHIENCTILKPASDGKRTLITLIPHLSMSGLVDL